MYSKVMYYSARPAARHLEQRLDVLGGEGVLHPLVQPLEVVLGEAVVALELVVQPSTHPS